MTDTHLGGCACGAVRYRVQGKPVLGTVCHCRFCQKRLASAFAVMASFKEDAIDILQGEQSEVEYLSDESGRWLRMSFCPKCGTTIPTPRKSGRACEPLRAAPLKIQRGSVSTGTSGFSQSCHGSPFRQTWPHILRASWRHPDNGGAHRTPRKNSDISPASAAGCSMAAKCPPLPITAQRRISL